jgi:hypothetical protein
MSNPDLEDVNESGPEDEPDASSPNPLFPVTAIESDVSWTIGDNPVPKKL